MGILADATRKVLNSDTRTVQCFNCPRSVEISVKDYDAAVKAGHVYNATGDIELSAALGVRGAKTVAGRPIFHDAKCERDFLNRAANRAAMLAFANPSSEEVARRLPAVLRAAEHQEKAEAEARRRGEAARVQALADEAARVARDAELKAAELAAAVVAVEA